MKLLTLGLQISKRSQKQQSLSNGLISLHQSLGQAPSEEVTKILAEREEVQPEPDLNPDSLRRLRARLADS